MELYVVKAKTVEGKAVYLFSYAGLTKSLVLDRIWQTAIQKSKTNRFKSKEEILEGLGWQIVKLQANEVIDE